MKNKLVTFLLASTILPSIVMAQGNPQTTEYSRNNRPTIQAESERFIIFMTRMAQLAEMAASGQFSSTQLLALSNEFDAWKQELDFLANVTHPLLSTQSNAFKSSNFSTAALGLASTSLDTTATPAGQMANRNALDAVNLAIANLYVLTSSSWQRITFNYSSNTGNCAGGYSSQDGAAVKNIFNKAVKYLLDSYNLMKSVGFGVLSNSQRTAVNADFDFLKEELEILGEESHSGVSAQTDQFLRVVLDPQYLGISNEHINSPTVEGAQQQAFQAISALGAAYSILVQCG